MIFRNAREKITKPARDVAGLAVLAIILALVAILFTAAHIGVGK